MALRPLDLTSFPSELPGITALFSLQVRAAAQCRAVYHPEYGGEGPELCGAEADAPTPTGRPGDGQVVARAGHDAMRRGLLPCHIHPTEPVSDR